MKKVCNLVSSGWPFLQCSLKMKFTTLFLLTSLAVTYANNVYSQKTKVSLDVINMEVGHVLEKIESTTDFLFIYAVRYVDVKRKVSISVKNEKIEKVLKIIFKDTNTAFEVIGTQVVLKEKKEESALHAVPTISAQPLPPGLQSTISGKVTDAIGPLPGVTIAIKGSTVIAISDKDGNFTINAAPTDTLVFTFLGFATQEKTVGSSTIIDVILLPDMTSLQEVVVNAGYYSVRDRERTGSIAKITAKEIENQPVTNVLSAMQGRMAGVSITQNSGAPGGGYDIQIRGKNSLRTRSSTNDIDGNMPLYVINGVPIGNEITSLYSAQIFPMRSFNPLNSINPNDIESIEILKDADATAIYGSRGANGVILVTTKKGTPRKLNLSINNSYGVSQIVSKMKLMNTEQYLGMRRQAFANDGITSFPATAYDVNGTWDQARYTDWTDTLIGNTATMATTQATLTGGSESTSFLIGLGHTEQTTVFANDFKYVTNTISNNINHRSADNRFLLNVSNLFSIQKNNVVNEDLTRKSLMIQPNAPALYNQDGSLNWENNTFNNPVAIYNSTYSNENKQLLLNFNTDYELFSKFHVKLNGGINYHTFEEWSLRPNTMYNPASAAGQSSAFSSALKSTQERFSFILEPQLSWTYKSDRHQLDLLAGGTFQKEENSQGAVTGTGFQSNAFIRNIGAATTKNILDQTNSEYKYAAVFGRINYQLDNKYIVNITGRRDGSSRFGPNKKFANFGAIGAAWLFSGEDFLKDLPWLSFGKLRGSYGSTGNDNIGDYQYIDTYTVSNFIYNNVAGLVPSRLYNPNYSWEKTTKLEAALELGLFDNRLNLVAAWYRNRSSSQLVGYQLPAITGFNSVLANLNATIENSGLELEFNARPFAKGEFTWDTGINISFPKNKLLSFPGLEGSTYANQYVVGQPTTIAKVFQLEGIDQATGRYIFTDFNGDGRISMPDDNKVIENIAVKYFGGVTNNLRYKNLNLSFLFQFVKQNNWNYNNIMVLPGSTNNQPVELLNVWSPENPNGSYMPYTIGANSAVNTLHTYMQRSNKAVSDASFVRLKNVQLSYKLPLKSNVFKDVNIYVQGQNLITWTKYFGMDPEFTLIGYLPPLKTYAFGVQFNL